MKAALSVPEAAELLGQSTSTIYKQVRRGVVPNVGIGAVRIPSAWIARRFAEAGAPLEELDDSATDGQK